jgi:tyrosinase
MVAGGERSRAVLLRALRRHRRDGRDPRAGAPCGRGLRGALSGGRARRDRAPRRRPRSDPLGAVRARGRLAEPFLFFIDAKGQPVSKTAARDYESIGDFAYDYQPGSGEGVVPKQVAAAPQMVRTQAPRFSAQIGNPIATASAPASGVVALPSALLQAADGPSAPVLLAKITLALPPLAHSGDLAVVVDAPGGDTGGGNVIPLSMFGHHIVQGPVTFTVPLGPPVAALRANNRLAANTLNFSVAQPAAVAMPTAHAHGADARVEVLSIVVEAH